MLQHAGRSPECFCIVLFMQMQMYGARSRLEADWLASLRFGLDVVSSWQSFFDRGVGAMRPSCVEPVMWLMRYMPS